MNDFLSTPLATQLPDYVSPESKEITSLFRAFAPSHVVPDGLVEETKKTGNFVDLLCAFLWQNCGSRILLQCCDSVDWATGRASGLLKAGCWFAGGYS